MTATTFRQPCEACLHCTVRTMAVCAALGDDEIGAMQAIMTSRRLDANETLVHEGDPKTKVFTLTAGMLRLTVGLPDGRRQVTGFLMPGDYLGLADDDVCSASAEAVEPSALCAFPASRMEALIEEYPNVGVRLHGFTRAALRQARENQLILGRFAPVEKLAAFIVFLSNRRRDNRLPENPVPLPMTRTDIADYLGLTIETVSRSFTKLRNQGLIGMNDPHVIEIRDRRALLAVAGV